MPQSLLIFIGERERIGTNHAHNKHSCFFCLHFNSNTVEVCLWGFNCLYDSIDSGCDFVIGDKPYPETTLTLVTDACTGHRGSMAYRNVIIFKYPNRISMDYKDSKHPQSAIQIFFAIERTQRHMNTSGAISIVCGCKPHLYLVKYFPINAMLSA